MTQPQTFGIGEWRTRDGRKATVTHIYWDNRHCLSGLVDHNCHEWAINGKYNAYVDGVDAIDLVSPWEEPEAPLEGSLTMSTESVLFDQPNRKTLLDEFAMAALTGLFAADHKDEWTIESKVRDAFSAANQCMEARKCS